MGWLKRTKKKADASSVRSARLNGEEQAQMFRRSRTLTGSASSKVTAAASPASHLASPRLRAHRLRAHRRLVGLGLLGAVSAALVMLWLLNEVIVEVRIASSQTTRSIDDGVYRKAVAEYLSGRPAERFGFMLNDRRMTAFLQQDHPEIASAKVQDAAGLASHDIVIVFRTPVAVWQVADQKFYVDNQGETFRVNLFEDPTIVIQDDSGIGSTDQAFVASNRLLAFIGRLAGGLERQQAGSIERAIVPRGALRELDIIVKGRAYPIKTQSDRDPVEQVADIVSALSNFDRKTIVPRYVDVRAAGKAYYQ